MSSNRTSDEWIDQYSRSHQHPVNQFCHMIGIPLSVGALVLAAVGAWRLALAAFVVGWIFQFVGHAFEGKPPEFFSNWRFLLVGLRWWVAKIGISPGARRSKYTVEHMTPAPSPILPRTVDARLRQTGVTLADIRRAIPDEYLEPDPLRAWWTLIRVAASAAVCLFLLSRLSLSPGSPLLWQIPVLLTLWIFYGRVLVGAFLIGHDCGHGSFSSSDGSIVSSDGYVWRRSRTVFIPGGSRTSATMRTPSFAATTSTGPAIWSLGTSSSRPTLARR